MPKPLRHGAKACLRECLGVVVVRLVDCVGIVDYVDVILLGITVCLGAFAHDVIAETVIRTDGCDTGSATEDMLEFVTAVYEGNGN